MDEFHFFWHDYETFGRVPRRDRPAQFAGVRTDAELNEIGAPVMHHCRPSADTLPDPEACLLTGILPQHCQARGLAEHDFAARIEAELAAPGTVGVGYNSIRFDDEVTRHLFWRNLIDPYAREWQHGCGRWDLLDTVRCAWALRPDGIEWPCHEDGRPSFKLEHLTAANGLAHEAAHDALSDVRATIALARLIRARQPRLWDFCLGLRHKDAVAREIGVDRPFVHLSGMYGTASGGLAIVHPLAPHPRNKNELLVWNLAHDPRELLDLKSDELRRRLFTKSDELPEGERRLPVKSVHLNRSPVVIGSLTVLTPAVQQRFGIDLPQALVHAEHAAEVARALRGVWSEVYRRPAPVRPVDVDEDLYGGFLGAADRRRLDRLRSLPGDALAVQARRAAFEDPRLEELLFRYRARNFPDSLDAAEQGRWTEHCAARLQHGDGTGGMTLARFLESLGALEKAEEEGADAKRRAVLQGLRQYAASLLPERPPIGDGLAQA